MRGRREAGCEARRRHRPRPLHRTAGFAPTPCTSLTQPYRHAPMHHMLERTHTTPHHCPTPTTTPPYQQRTLYQKPVARVVFHPSNPSNPSNPQTLTYCTQLPPPAAPCTRSRWPASCSTSWPPGAASARRTRRASTQTRCPGGTCASGGPPAGSVRWEVQGVRCGVGGADVGKRCVGVGGCGTGMRAGRGRGKLRPPLSTFPTPHPVRSGRDQAGQPSAH